MLIGKSLVGPLSGILCALSLGLTLLCVLLDGSSNTLGADCAILTLNTSQIGDGLVDSLPGFDLSRRSNPLASLRPHVTAVKPATNVPKITEGLPITRVAGSDASKLTAVAHSAAQSVVSSAKDGLSEAAGDLVKAIGVYDFYNVHLLNLCEGYFVPERASSTSIPQNSTYQNMTSCSARSLTHDFNPVTMLQQQVVTSSSKIVDLQLPDQLTTGLNALRAAQHVLVGFYCVAVVLMSIALILTMLNVCCNSTIVSRIVSMNESVAAVALFVSSAMVTILAAHIVGAINRFGGAIGISATTGTGFLCLTWVAWLSITASAII